MSEGRKNPKGGRSAGRKSIFSEEVAKRILDAVAMGAPDRVAYGAAGIGHSTFYKWVEWGTDAPAKPATDTTPAVPARKARSPFREFVERLNVAREQFKLSHIANITHHAQGTVVVTETVGEDGRVVARTTERRADGDWRASKYLLAVRDPENFSERHVVENRHTDATGTGPVTVHSTIAAVREAKGLTPEQLRAAGRVDTSDLGPAPEGEDE